MDHHQVHSSKPNPSSSSKLCPKHTTVFKKSAKGLAMRQDTVIKKARELSKLCGTELCLFQFDLNGQLINTWAQDHTNVRDIALSYQRLPEAERRKKSTTLCQFLHKKMLDERNQSLKNNDNKFNLKVEVMYASLQSRFPELQQKMLRLQEQAQRYESRAEDPQLNHHTSGSGDFSLFLFNHDNSTFTPLPSTNDYGLLLDPQACANNTHLLPPLMQTQNPSLLYTQNPLHHFDQTPSS